MTTPAAGPEARPSFDCDGVDETVSDKAILRSLKPSVYSNPSISSPISRQMNELMNELIN